MPAGKSELVGQCTVLRNEERAETPVLPVVTPKQMEGAPKCMSTIGKHDGRGWKGAAQLPSLVRALLPPVPGSCQPGLRMKGLRGQGRGSAGTGPPAPRIENQPNRACLFPLVRDGMIGVSCCTNPPPRPNNYTGKMPACRTEGTSTWAVVPPALVTTPEETVGLRCLLRSTISFWFFPFASHSINIIVISGLKRNCSFVNKVCSKNPIVNIYKQLKL